MAATAPVRRAYRFGQFVADLPSGELHKNGITIKLGQQPFQILTLLLEHAGQVVSREQLRQALWPADTFVDFEHNMNSAINKLREALNDSADSPRFIETLPRRGYRFIYPVNGASAASATTAVPVPVARWRARWVVGLLGLAALLAIAIALNLGNLRERVFGVNVGPIESVAVLPCKNLTGDPEQEFLADGLTDVLTTHLAQIKSLIVPSVTSAMYFKGERKRLPEIARELKVQAVVEPSVQRTGQRLLINFQLIHGPTDRHLWAKSYETDSKNLPALLPSVAREILEAINAPLTPGETSRLSNQREIAPEAYDAYLKARFFQSTGTRHGRARAEEFFLKAIELDPNFAEPYSRLALLYAHGGAYLAGGDLAARAKTREYGHKALELDPQNAEVYAAFAWADLSDWDFEGAERNFKQAIALNPNLPVARVWYAQFLGAMRRFDEAFVQAERARQLVPLEVAALSHAALPYWQSGNVTEFERRIQEMADLDPGYWFGYHLAALAHLQRGKYEQAIAALQRSILLREANPTGPGSPYGEGRNAGVLAYAYAKAGRREEALKIVRDLERREKVAGAHAIAYVGLGNYSRALDQMEHSYERHGAGLWMNNADPLLEPLYSQPRFQALVRRIGLVQAGTAAAKREGSEVEKPPPRKTQ